MGRKRKLRRNKLRAAVPENRLRRIFQRDPEFRDESLRVLRIMSGLPLLAVATREYERYRSAAIGFSGTGINPTPIRSYVEWCTRRNKAMAPRDLARWTARWLDQRCPACATSVQRISGGAGLFQGLCERCAPILAP